jgi:hypothetical protein
MRHSNCILLALLALALAALCATSALAQEVLPKPEPPFGGKIGEAHKNSTPVFSKPVTAPAPASSSSSGLASRRIPASCPIRRPGSPRS